MFGKDVFVFVLDKSGILVPYGSNMHKHVAYAYHAGAAFSVCGKIGGKHTDYYGVESNNYEQTGDTCTGKIADNGWKADY